MSEFKKYTLDRIEDGYYVFLLYPEEETELIIPTSKISKELHEGDVVHLGLNNEEYVVDILAAEKIHNLTKVNELLNKLKNK